MPALTPRFLLFAASFVTSPSQEQTPATPQLIVVIGINQFPNEYLTRFATHSGPGGFRRLLKQDAGFCNASYKDAKDLTGPGRYP